MIINFFVFILFLNIDQFVWFIRPFCRHFIIFCFADFVKSGNSEISYSCRRYSKY